MYRAIGFVVLVFAAGAIADPALQLPCSETTQCQVNNVDITPCANKNACLLKIGKNATIRFDYIPEFAAEELVTDVSWQGISFGDIDRDACKSTACPVSAGVKQTLTYNLPLRKKSVSKGTFTIKWKLWNKADDAQLCCFETTIRLR